MNKFSFKITPDERVIFKSCVPVEKVFLFDEVKIMFIQNKKKYVLCNDLIKEVLDTTRLFLKKVLKSLKLLDPSINKDIGLIWNDVSQNKTPYRINGEVWQGVWYLLWEGSNGKESLATWLYNDPDGKIVVHITENYFWHFRDKSKDKNYISYNEFIKNYKPILIRVIPHQVARQWLAQCEYLLATIKENDKRARQEHEIALANGTCKDCA